MGEWVIGAFINLLGSIIINFGTNLLKLGHDQRIKHSALGNEGTNGKAAMKPIIHFQTWRIGILFFALGNCLNFISFGFAAQSLLAALGSIQFVSNIAFAYFVFNKTVTIKVLVATTFIVLGNIFLVAFGNHQSPVYTPEQLAEKYSNITFLLYCLILVLVVAFHHSVYRRGELLLNVPGNDLKPFWQMLLPFSYAIVSGTIGSFSVLFAKSLSNLLRLSISNSYLLHSWFTYSMLLLFLSTAGFWMARLNEGLSRFDAILIVPMFQIAWTFFSICTGFVYFQEYQVFDALRTTMFVLGVMCVFIGISLLAPDDSKGIETKDSSLVSASSLSNDVERLIMPLEDPQLKDVKSFSHLVLMKAVNLIVKAKAACSLSLGLGDDSLQASSVLVMPMVSSKMTGFRGNGVDQAKLFSARGQGWRRISVDEDCETSAMLPLQSMV
nr:probable magnesium transporter NIPA8 isoform X1 [Ipomoea batatas]